METKTQESKYAELVMSLTQDFMIGKIDFNHYAHVMYMLNEEIQKLINHK